ncbi:hypothetical protein BN2127_JRS1_02400 [Bacillus cereus]|nr:hypothetical protein BN2127_JRS1_02400 [Bacillus cereus]
MGFIMAVIFTTVVYLFCIKRYKLSWKDIGIRKLSWKDVLWTVGAVIFLIVASIAHALFNFIAVLLTFMSN